MNHAIATVHVFYAADLVVTFNRNSHDMQELHELLWQFWAKGNCRNYVSDMQSSFLDSCGVKMQCDIVAHARTQ
jgi:hypothetical protein